MTKTDITPLCRSPEHGRSRFHGVVGLSDAQMLETAAKRTPAKRTAPRKTTARA